MEKGMAGDRPAQAAAAPANPGATVERGVEGRNTTPMETPKSPRRGGGSGKFSGEMLHQPASGDVATTLKRDDEGTWRATSEDITYRWDPEAKKWRGETPFGAEDIEAPPPEEWAAQMQSRTQSRIPD